MALSEARDQLREARDEAADNNNPEHVILDQQVQRASVQLAATSIRSRYPDADTLILRENEDGEQQYEVLGVHDNLGYPVDGTAGTSDWTRDEVAGENSADLQELSWALNPEDDAWADGIAEITTTREYGKTAKINLDAALALPAPQSAPTEPDIAAMAEARDALMEKWEAHSRKSPDFDVIDQQMQHAAVQLAAAAVRRDFPAAKTLVLRENEDGENQYDPMAINNGEGFPIVDLEGDRDWTRNEVNGDNSVNLSELAWTLNLEDDAWAGGIAEIHDSKHNGKVATIDIDAALAKPAPKELTAVDVAAKRHAGLSAAKERTAAQARLANIAAQQASVQLLSTVILDKLPTATRLSIRDDADGNGRFEAVCVFDTEGSVLATGDLNEDGLFDERFGEGETTLHDLIQELDVEECVWGEGVARFTANKHQKLATIYLHAARNKPVPVFQE